MLDRLGFLIGEALTAMRRNRGMALAAITTATVALFLIGGLGYTYLRIYEYTQSLPGKLEMRVYLADNADYEDVQAVAKRIRQLPGVAQAVWLPKDKVWEVWRKEKPLETQGLENPFPHGFKVVLSDLSASDEVASQIRAMEEIDKGPMGVQYFHEVHQLFSDAMTLIQRFGSVLGGLLFLTSGVLIFTAVRLTVIARRLELRIMQLVGASRFTINVPYLIEGVVQGTVAGIVATFALWLSNNGVNQYLEKNTNWGQLPPFPFWDIALILCGIGAAYGIVCSTIALKARLQYR